MYMVRGTELQDFLRCRKMWSYRWIDGLQPKKPNNKLLFGTLFHKFLESYYALGNVKNAWSEVYESCKSVDWSLIDQLEQDDLFEMLDHVILNYVEKYKDDLNNWEVIATELTFAIPLDDEIGYTGTIDLIVRDKSDGRIYFLDHKTTNSIEKYDKNSDMDRQISRYWWALQQLQQGNGLVRESEDHPFWDINDMPLSEKLKDVEIGGFLYNIILKDYPVPPKVLKNGSLSKDKSQKTTYEMYLDELNNRELIPKDTGWAYSDYADILQHFIDNPKEFFRRIRVTRTQSEIDASIEELYATAMDMDLQHYGDGTTRPAPRIYRNITKECHWCPFQPICRASMDGSNANFLVESLYTKEETK